MGLRTVNTVIAAGGLFVLHELASAVSLILTCFFCFRLQDIDIKRNWPGCVIAEPYVLVRSLPYTRGQVRRVSDPGFLSRRFVGVVFGRRVVDVVRAPSDR